MKKDVYLFHSGTLKRKDNTLVYETNEQVYYFPIVQIRAIHVFGEISFNKPLINLLSKNGIGVSFYDYQGRYIGQYMPANCKSGKVLIEQVLAWQDTVRRNQIAYSIVISEISNCLCTAKYYSDVTKREKLQGIISSLNSIIYDIRKMDGVEVGDPKYINRLLLLEARAKKNYYEIFDIVNDIGYFQFGKRTAYPANNAVNSMMNFCYAVLYGKVASEIDRSDLVKEISYVHGLTHHQNGALQFDIADIYKSIMIDRAIIEMIQGQIVNEKDFYRRFDDAVYLTTAGRRKVVSHLDYVFSKPHDIGTRNMCFQEIIRSDINNLTTAITCGEEFMPIRIDVEK